MLKPASSVLCLICLAFHALALDPPCAQDKRVVATCFALHGRLAVYANMRPYLRTIGSRHLLALAFKSDTNIAYDMPDDLAELLSQDKQIFGDFTACPLTKPKPGKMQLVCIDSVKNISVKNSR